jgi:hypothetical protein
MSNLSQPSGAKLQEKSQETPTNPPTDASAEAPIYTKTQTQELIKEAVSKEMSQLRKGEAKRYEKLEADYLTLKSDKLALESQVEDVEVLKGQIAELHELKTEGLPTEAKDYLKLKAQVKEAEIRGSKDYKSLKERLEKYETTEKSILVEKLVKTLGISKETLNKFPIEHLKDLDSEEVAKPEAKVPEATTEKEPVDKMPAPETGAIQSGGGQTDAEFWKAYGQPGFQATPADHKRANEIRTKAIKGG